MIGGIGLTMTPEERETLRLSFGDRKLVEPVAATLSLDQRFRLVEIAHESGDARVREAALKMLAEPRYIRAVSE